MKQIRFLIWALGLVLAWAVPAQAGMITFDFPISVEQEVPAPNIPDGFSPTGNGIVMYDTDTNLLEWNIEYEGLTGDIVAPGAHFHGPADFGMTAGIQVFLTDGDPAEPPTGVLMGSTTISDVQEADLLAGLWYVNIHTGLNGSGEIRGQVVPEPASMALLLGGSLLALRRRRKS